MYTGQSKKFDFEQRSPKKKRKKPAVLTPGLNLLSPEERREILRKVRVSRHLSDERKAKKEQIEKERKRQAFEKFVSDLKKRDNNDQ
ncbi:hypothetical protein [Maritimibacter sp. DP1N21-5]|uniref:hypothetical protein n=1 Tax=Maritimibacter sp. DP1N21-5 TaxID=2836867 RepID=UPI001C473711|nr:hypothetical protein [Maritimibacter sp. DP1N21-5]MBV7410865.1 hypothetical protein [Maritimibacter sp. DP1N21-5]